MNERGGAIIEAQSLRKVYGNTTAVDGIDFQVKPGVVTGFLGPNGAGKSTTMRMILGLDLPTSGTVTVGGHRYQGEVWPLHEVGKSSPRIMRMVVDLPAPFGPRNPVTIPGLTWKSIPSTAVVSP